MFNIKKRHFFHSFSHFLFLHLLERPHIILHDTKRYALREDLLAGRSGTATLPAKNNGSIVYCTIVHIEQVRTRVNIIPYCSTTKIMEVFGSLRALTTCGLNALL